MNEIAKQFPLKFGLWFYFMWRAEGFNAFGIKLIALNKFLSGYLDTNEPFPLTENFIETVKKEVANSKDLYGYSPTPPKHYPAVVHLSRLGAEEDLNYNVLAKIQHKKYEEYKEPIWSEVANLQISKISKKWLEAIGLSNMASVTSRKTYVIEPLIQYAVACFFYANTFFHMSALLRGNRPPAYRQEGINYFSDPLPGFWHDILDAADSCLQYSSYQIGYCTREIEILREQKKGMQESNKKKKQKYAKAKQRTIEIYNTIDNRSEMLASNPYKLAEKIWNKLMAEGLAANELVPNKKKPDQKSQKRKRPRRDTILRWIKEETST